MTSRIATPRTASSCGMFFDTLRRRQLFFPRADVHEPVAIEVLCGRPPGIRHLASRQRGGEGGEQLLAPVDERPRLQRGQRLDGLRIEVAVRQRRIRVALAAEEAPD